MYFVNSIVGGKWDFSGDTHDYLIYENEFDPGERNYIRQCTVLCFGSNLWVFSLLYSVHGIILLIVMHTVIILLKNLILICKSSTLYFVFFRTLGEAWSQLKKSLADEAEVHLKFSSKVILNSLRSFIVGLG